MKYLILIVCISFPCAISAESTLRSVEDVVKAAAKSSQFNSEDIQAILALPYNDDFQRAIVSAMVWCKSENPADTGKAREALDRFIQYGPEGWQRDFALINFAFVQHLAGEHEAGARTSMEILEAVDFKRLSKITDPFMDLLRSQSSASQFGYENYLRGALLQSLGYHMMNRSAKDGGPDYAAAQQYFSQIPDDEPRKEAMKELIFRAQTRGIKLPSSASDAGERGRNEMKVRPNDAHPHASETKQPHNQPTTNSFRQAPTTPVVSASDMKSQKWLSWVLVVLGTITGIWLLVRKILK